MIQWFHGVTLAVAVDPILTKGGYKILSKGGVLMDVGLFVGIIALCIACFMVGVQYGKDHRNEK